MAFIKYSNSFWFLVIICVLVFRLELSSSLVILKNTSSSESTFPYFPFANQIIASELQNNNVFDSNSNSKDLTHDVDDILLLNLETLKAYHEEFPPPRNIPLKTLRRVKRIKRDEGSEPGAQTDKKPDSNPESKGEAKDGKASDPKEYPKETTPNVTCITMADLQMKKSTMTKAKIKRCPKKFPCKDFDSCLIWRTGFVDKNLKLDLTKAQAYYTDLFTWLHKTKLEQINKMFGECVQEYKLSEEFKDPNKTETAGKSESGGGGESKKTKRETGADAGGSKNAVEGEKAKETPGATGGAGDSEAKDRGVICVEKIEDFLECFDRAALQGTCWWPDRSSSESKL